MSRKPLGKKLRFDVFKRDAFTCCYCGQQPPVVVLEVDHVVPVCEGGSDLIDNLATACWDCNRGKAGVSLTVLPGSLAAQRAELLERDEQERAYIRFVKGKRRRQRALFVEIAEALCGPGHRFVPRVESSVRVFIEGLPYDQVLLAAEKSAAKFPQAEDDRGSRRFRYFCGICWRLLHGDDCKGKYRR